jgi:hypothetical protein
MGRGIAFEVRPKSARLLKHEDHQDRWWSDNARTGLGAFVVLSPLVVSVFDSGRR